MFRSFWIIIFALGLIFPHGIAWSIPEQSPIEHANDEPDATNESNPSASEEPKGSEILAPAANPPKETHNQAPAKDTSNHPPQDSYIAYGDTWAQWIMAISGAFAVFISGVAVLLLWRTLKATREAVRQSAIATKTAQDAVEVTRDIGNRQTRAYLTIKECTIEYVKNQPIATVVIINSGQTPANNVMAFGRIYISKNPGAFLQVVDVDKMSKGRIGREGRIILAAKKKEAMSSEEVDGLKAGTHTLVVHGDVEYTDVFGVRWTFQYQFCTGGKYGDALRIGRLPASYKTYKEHEKSANPTA